MEENAAEPNLSSILDAFYNQMNRLREVALRKRPLLINNLEESWCNAKPLEVSSAGQQKPSPVQQRHYKTVVERFPHGVFVSAVQRSEERRVGKDVNLQLLCDANHDRHEDDGAHILALENKVTGNKYAGQKSIKREIAHGSKTKRVHHGLSQRVH